jgi:UDP-N-acetylmuramate dehydrogenase
VPPAYPAGEGHTKTSAAWLIDKAGFTKGYGCGPARISTKHTLALTNRGGATTAELLDVAREIRDGVEARFNVRLRPEAHLVGVEL